MTLNSSRSNPRGASTRRLAPAVGWGWQVWSVGTIAKNENTHAGSPLCRLRFLPHCLGGASCGRCDGPTCESRSWRPCFGIGRPDGPLGLVAFASRSRGQRQTRPPAAFKHALTPQTRTCKHNAKAPSESARRDPTVSQSNRFAPHTITTQVPACLAACRRLTDRRKPVGGVV